MLKEFDLEGAEETTLNPASAEWLLYRVQPAVDLQGDAGHEAFCEASPENGNAISSGSASVAEAMQRLPLL